MFISAHTKRYIIVTKKMYDQNKTKNKKKETRPTKNIVQTLHNLNLEHSNLVSQQYAGF